MTEIVLERESMKKEITVHCIAQTRMNREEMQAWLRDVGAEGFAEKLPYTYHEVCNHDFEVVPESEVTDADLLTAVAGKRCYNSFEVGMNPNVSKIREDWTAYIDNVLASGHGSVTEHSSWTWAIEGCTRVMTAEANRHRAGVAISEASLRYIRFDSSKGIPYWEPLSLRRENYVGPNHPDILNDEEKYKHYERWVAQEGKKMDTRALFGSAFTHALFVYQSLEEIWAEELKGDFATKKKLTSMFRRIIPLGVAVGAIYTLNTRSLRHVMTMRCDPSAEEEIAYVFGMIAKKMFESEPRLFGDFVEENGFWRPKYRKV